MGRRGIGQLARQRIHGAAARDSGVAGSDQYAGSDGKPGPDGRGDRVHFRRTAPPSEAQQGAPRRALQLSRLSRLPMVISRYTQWDGSQKVRLDAEKVFEKLAEFLSLTDDVH